jgi:hypothetical protein
MLGAFLVLGRTMLEEPGGFDERFASTVRTSSSATGPPGAGWELWYVPQAVVTHRYAAEIDRRLLARKTLCTGATLLDSCETIRSACSLSSRQDC